MYYTTRILNLQEKNHVFLSIPDPAEQEDPDEPLPPGVFDGDGTGIGDDIPACIPHCNGHVGRAAFQSSDTGV